MTFSIIAKCSKSGAFGAAITTSNMAVGSRCVRLAHGKGAFLSQHRTDPRLGDTGISYLKSDLGAEAAVLKTSTLIADIEWRQLGALDVHGHSAVFHGRRMYSIYTHTSAKDCLALGNILANEKVTVRMAEAFTNSSDHTFADRLMIALEAGRDAGGEVAGPLRSSSLRVTGEMGIDLCDLRVDYAPDDAVGDLRTLFDAYQSHGELLRNLALEPNIVPISRALFDASIARIRELGLKDRFPSEQNAESWKF